MNNLSKIFTLAATLTLAAGCDAEPELGDVDGDSDIAFRPSGPSGVRFNGQLINDFDYDMVHLGGKFYEGIELSKVCLRPPKYGNDEFCLIPTKDRIWVQGTEFFGHKKEYGMTFNGIDFAGSRWFMKIDADGDGVLDSKVVLNIDSVKEQTTPQGDKYWGYLWTYFTYELAGPIAKDVEQQKKAVPTCEVDPDTGSMETVLSRDLHVDMTTGDFSEVPDTVFIGCMKGAVSKAQAYWGYLQDSFGYKYVEMVVRNVRADYCGTGLSHTEDGTPTQQEDKFGMNKFVDPSRQTEAHWDFGVGAVCLYEPRHPDVDYEKIYSECGIPKCDPAADLSQTGAQMHSKIW
ncbi:MAG: ADYC domain-containing protein [Nannocystaceae bacterium]